MPKFSIVTSFFGEPKEYVRRLYQNILETKVDWEWIVTEDFSKNKETEKELLKISKNDSRVKKIKQKTKREIFRDPSLYATGEFIFHIDADDEFHPLYLKHCEKWFKKFPDVVCIISGAIWKDERGRITNYYTDKPFVKPGIKNGIIYPNYNFLGRIWRSNIRLEHFQIFENPEEIIRFNDKIIVDFLSTKGEILYLPRTYIKYESRQNSNSKKERSDLEKKLIEKTHNELQDWVSKNKNTFSSCTHFYAGEDDFETEVTPFLHIDWGVDSKKVGVIGFSDIPIRRKLLQDLYPEFELNFDPSEKEIENLDFVVICNIKERLSEIPKIKTYLAVKGSNNFENFSKDLRDKCNFIWTGANDIFWVKKI